MMKENIVASVDKFFETKKWENSRGKNYPTENKENAAEPMHITRTGSVPSSNKYFNIYKSFTHQ